MTAFTGAGISKASGIPTFEELGDIRDKLSRDFFTAHPQEFFDLLKMLRDKCDDAQPNAAHMALAKCRVPVVTMNVDGLHHRAGSDALEIHGHLRRVFCKACSKEYDFAVIYNSIHCSQCGSLLEPNVVLYGDRIPQYEKAIDIVCSGDLLLVVGTSFVTSTAHMTMMARQSGIETLIINEDGENRVPALLKALGLYPRE